MGGTRRHQSLAANQAHHGAHRWHRLALGDPMSLNSDPAEDMDSIANESSRHFPNPLLAGLAEAMRSAAEEFRRREVERCHVESTENIDRLVTRREEGAGALRMAAEADEAAIMEWSKARLDEVRVATDDQVAQCFEGLAHDQAEIERAVELRVARAEGLARQFEDELAQLFEQLPDDADPTAFASLASQMASPPDFALEVDGRADETEPQDIERALGSQSAATESSNQPITTDPIPEQQAQRQLRPDSGPVHVSLSPGTLTGAGAVRGRYFPEWYGEVDWLRTTGREADAVALLLDIVYATEAESRAEGGPVAPRAYHELAEIHAAGGDIAAEFAIVERFSRQNRAQGAVQSQLLARWAFLKKSAKR